MFVNTVDRTSPQSKIDGLVASSADFIQEMQHQARIRCRWRVALRVPE